MASPAGQRESAPLPHQHLSQQLHHNQLQQQPVLHQHAYSSHHLSRGSSGSSKEHITHHHTSLPSHAYNGVPLPAEPRPTADRHGSSRASSKRQSPLSEQNVAALAAESRSQSITSQAYRTQPPLRAHASHSNPRTSQASVHSHRQASPVRQISDTPRVLYSDPEKQDWSSGEHYHSTYSEEDLADAPPPESTTNVLKALCHLSFSAPFVALVVALYTLLVLLYSTLASIVSLCTAGPSFRQRTTALLAPSLRLHLRCVCAPASAVQRDHRTLARHLGPLISAQLVSPLAAMPMAMAGWVVAIFWTLSALIADEGGNGDGKRLAMTLADWWIWWLEGRAFR